MKIRTVDRKPVRVAARRYVGPYGERVGKFWRSLVTPWLAENGIVDCPRYGVPLDNPMSTPPEQCRYDCCVELPAGLTVGDAADSTIEGGTYAVARFKGTDAQIGAAWEGFVRDCMMSGLKLDPRRRSFEHYPRGATFDPKTGEFACELCLPIEDTAG